MSYKSFIINFAETSHGDVKITNQSTACIIEIALKAYDGSTASLYLDYSEFDDLIKAIDSIRMKENEQGS